MKLFKSKFNSKGFTLLEILVVISIIGILIALGASAYSVAQKKSRDARRQGDLKQMQNAFEQYYAASGTSSYNTCDSMDDTTFPGGSRPSDPKGTAPYVYSCFGDSDGYCACAVLESGTGNASDTASSTSCPFSTPGGSFFCVTNLQ